MNKNTISPVIIVAVLVGGFLYYLNSKNLSFDKITISRNPGFIFTDNLFCKILYSTDKEDSGKNLSFLGLKTTEPKILFESGLTSPMTKVFETDELLVIQLVASGSGSVDTFHLDKEKGTFVRVSSGICAGEYAMASKGNCK